MPDWMAGKTCLTPYTFIYRCSLRVVDSSIDCSMTAVLKKPVDWWFCCLPSTALAVQVPPILAHFFGQRCPTRREIHLLGFDIRHRRRLTTTKMKEFARRWRVFGMSSPLELPHFFLVFDDLLQLGQGFYSVHLFNVDNGVDVFAQERHLTRLKKLGFWNVESIVAVKELQDKTCSACL